MTQIGQREIAASADKLLENASAATGLGDFGPGDFREGFGRLLEAYDRSEYLSDEGRQRALDQAGHFLRARLRAVDGWRRHPRYADGQILAPVVITGMPRTGTTALHKLLSLDPRFQGTEHWIAMSPMPRPARDQWTMLDGYLDAAKMLAEQTGIAVEMVSEHGMAVDDVEETYYLLAQNFCANHYATQLPLPDYDRWYQTQDARPSYVYVDNILKLVGLGDNRRWLLKNPSDAFDIDALLAVFPDAQIIQTHRDPLQVMPSLINVLRGQFRLFARADMPLHIALAREVAYWSEAMVRMDAARRRVPTQFFDVDFRDFVRDQISAVRRIYGAFGFDLEPEIEAKMRGWLDKNPRNSTSLRRFTPEDFGMSSNELLERFADYRDQFGYAR